MHFVDLQQEDKGSTCSDKRMKYLGYCEGRTPVVLEDVQTDSALTVDIAVVDTSTECHLGGVNMDIFRTLDYPKQHSNTKVFDCWGKSGGMGQILEYKLPHVMGLS